MPIFAHSLLFGACAGVCQIEKTVAATSMDAGTPRKRRFDITVPTSRQLQEFAAIAPGSLPRSKCDVAATRMDCQPATAHRVPCMAGRHDRDSRKSDARFS